MNFFKAQKRSGLNDFVYLLTFQFCPDAEDFRVKSFHPEAVSAASSTIFGNLNSPFTVCDLFSHDSVCFLFLERNNSWRAAHKVIRQDAYREPGRFETLAGTSFGPTVS